MNRVTPLGVSIGRRVTVLIAKAVIDGVVIPYEDEPLADCGEEVSPNANEEETDIDGLTPSTLESRFGGNVYGYMVSWKIYRDSF